MRCASFFVSSFVLLLLVATRGSVLADDSTSHRKGGYSIHGRVQLNRKLNTPFRATVHIDGGRYKTIVRLDGTFVVSNVPSGQHTVDVHCVDFIFDPIRVDVSARENGKVSASPLLDGAYMQLSYPLLFKPVLEPKYYQVREPMSLKPLLANPMILIMGGLFLMMMYFQRVMADMDPEQLEEMKKMQAQYSFKNLAKSAAEGVK